MCVGLWYLLLGLLNVGFVFGSLVSMVSQFTIQFNASLHGMNHIALGLIARSVVFLVGVQKVWKKCGGRIEAIRLAMANRNALCLVWLSRWSELAYTHLANLSCPFACPPSLPSSLFTSSM